MKEREDQNIAEKQNISEKQRKCQESVKNREIKRKMIVIFT